MELTRKEALTAFLASAAVSTGSESGEAQTAAPKKLTTSDLEALERIAGFQFSETERKEILDDVEERLKGYSSLRASVPDGSAAPQTIFTPIGGGSKPGAKVRAVPSPPGKLNGKLLEDDEAIAFLPVHVLGHLVRTQQISPVRLTKIYLERLKRYGDKLLCLVTLTEKPALEQAAKAEKEIAAGKYRGPLHGIPYGIKDLFATKGIPTQWGAAPYEGQVFDYDSAVVEKLTKAGAILCAKLSLGSLAMDDVWYKGKTKNPWNPKEGSSGSSAGSACATAAGLVAFAIGTETQGSITSPSLRCRVTGLRPTYGRVSKFGAMELSYTMDKVGPICRNVEDCALVFAAICGSDSRDPSAVDRSFSWPHALDYKKLKIGYLMEHDEKNPTAKEASDGLLKFLKAKGAQLKPLNLTPLPDISEIVLDAEAASAFDELTRSGKVNGVTKSLWPQIFRGSRSIPAVEYLQAQRLRTIAMHRAERELGDLDLFVSYGMGENTVPLVNQCGYPQVIIPNGTATDKGREFSISYSFTGRLYQEDLILAVASDFQNQGDFHHRKPDLSVF